MRIKHLVAPILALVLALAACGGDDDTASPGDGGSDTSSPAASLAEGDAAVGTQVVVPLETQNDSGITGTASIVQTAAGKVTVSVNLTGAGAGPQPIHIHPGTCEKLDKAPKYPLTNVADGTSTTEVEVGLNTLLDGSFAINVHKSPSEAQIYVACGTIKRA